MQKFWAVFAVCLSTVALAGCPCPPPQVQAPCSAFLSEGRLGTLFTNLDKLKVQWATPRTTPEGETEPTTPAMVESRCKLAWTQEVVGAYCANVIDPECKPDDSPCPLGTRKDAVKTCHAIMLPVFHARLETCKPLGLAEGTVTWKP